MSGYHKYVRVKMDGLPEPWQNLKYEACFDFVCDVCCTSENPLTVGDSVWSTCNTMKTDRYGAWLSTVAWQMLTAIWAPSMSTTDGAWHTETFSCWHCRRARHSLGSAQNCPGPTGLHIGVCALGAKKSYRWWQSSLYGTVWAFLVSIGHVTLIKESSFRAETWLITQNLKPEKGCVREKLSSPSSKENGSIVIGKDDCGKLSWEHKHVPVLDFLHRGDTVCWLSLWYT